MTDSPYIRDAGATPDFNEKQEVTQLLAKTAFLPRFSRQLERLFLLSYAHHHRSRMRVTLALGLVLYLLAGAFEFHFAPATRTDLWLVRYVLTAPFIAAALSTAFWMHRDASLEAVYSIAVLAAGAGSGLSVFLYPQTAGYEYAVSVIVILFFVYVISGMRISYGLPCALLVTGMYVAAAISSGAPAGILLGLPGSLLVVMNIAGVYAGYRLEKEARRSFLHGRLVRLLNDEMVELVGVDELTGLANRRRMDDFFANTWARAQRDKAELTLLMLDVDYMQFLNDHLGRNIGDICLRKLGAVIQHYRKRPGDLAARYEGEKFLIVLYGCNEPHGRTMAERLRRDIESLNLMNPTSPAGWTVTISIGVHTVVPTRNQSSSSALLSVDTLLYMAKKRGRNCVVSDRDAANSDSPVIQEVPSIVEKTLVLTRAEQARSM